MNKVQEIFNQRLSEDVFEGAFSFKGKRYYKEKRKYKREDFERDIMKKTAACDFCGAKGALRHNSKMMISFCEKCFPEVERQINEIEDVNLSGFKEMPGGDAD